MNKKIKAFLIARVSDLTQKEALPAQKKRLEEYARKQGYDFEYFEFNETAYTDDRRKFEQIIQKIIIDSEFYYCILVFDKVDRLTRDSTSKIVGDLKNLAKKGKIELHFPSDNMRITQNTPATEMAHFGVNAVFAEYYSGAISDNVKRRFEQKLNDGECLGKAPIGYKNITLPNGKKDVVIDSWRSKYIKEIFSLRIKNYSYRHIAKMMREKGLYSNTKNKTRISASNIEQILNNPFYYGEMRIKGVLYPHKYPPLITKQTFFNCQKVSAERRKNKTKNNKKHNYAFNGGIIKCGKCGCSMSSYTTKGIIYLQCSKAKGLCRNNCAEKIILNQIESEIIKNIHIPKNIADSIIEEIRKKHKSSNDHLKETRTNLQEKYKKLENRKNNAYLDRLDGRITIDMYDKFVNQIDLELNEIDTILQNITLSEKDNITNASYLLDLVSNIDTLFKSSEPLQKNALIKILIPNSKINEKRLHFNLSEPFLTLSNCNKTQIWLPLIDTLLTNTYHVLLEDKTPSD